MCIFQQLYKARMGVWVECVFSSVLVECHLIILQHYVFVKEGTKELCQVLNSQNTPLEKLDRPSSRWAWGNQIHKLVSHLCLEFSEVFIRSDFQRIAVTNHRRVVSQHFDTELFHSVFWKKEKVTGFLKIVIGFAYMITSNNT